MSILSIVIQNLILIASVGFAFICSNSQLSSYSLQFISLTIIIFFLVQIASRRHPRLKNKRPTINFSLLTFVSYLIIFSTGGLLSPLFFLVYFLLFAITLFAQPTSSLSLALVSSIFFLANPRQDIFAELLQLSSLFFITPLALFFGSQYKKVLQNETEIAYLKHEENLLTTEVVKQEKEVESWTSVNLRQSLIKIWENLEKVSQDYSVSPNAKAKLNEISNQLTKLLKSAQDMKEKIEK